MRIKKNTMNYDQNDCQQFSFITPLFATIANALKTKVGDVVGCIFEVECSVGGFLILKQIIPFFFVFFCFCRFNKEKARKKIVTSPQKGKNWTIFRTRNLGHNCHLTDKYV
jgi:hypothetical protein